MNIINKMKNILKTMIIVVLFQGITYHSTTKAMGGIRFDEKSKRAGYQDFVKLSQALEAISKSTVDQIKSTPELEEYYTAVLGAIRDRNAYVNYLGLPKFSEFIKTPLEKTPLWRQALRLSASNMCMVFEQYFSPFLNVSVADLEKNSTKDLYQAFLAHVFTLAQEGKCWQKQLKNIENELKLLKPSFVGRYSRYGRQVVGTKEQQEATKSKADFLLRAMADSAMRNYFELVKIKEATKRSTLQKITFRGKAQEPDVYMLSVFSTYKNNFSALQYLDFRNQMLSRFKDYAYGFKIPKIEALRRSVQITKKTEPSHMAKYGKSYMAGLAVTAAISTYLYLNWDELKKEYGEKQAMGVLNYMGRSIKASPTYFWGLAKDLPEQIWKGIKATPEYLKTKGGDVIKYATEAPGRFKEYAGKKYEGFKGYFKRDEKAETPGTESSEKIGYFERFKRSIFGDPKVEVKKEGGVTPDNKLIEKEQIIDKDTQLPLATKEKETDLNTGNSKEKQTFNNPDTKQPEKIVESEIKPDEGKINTTETNIDNKKGNVEIKQQELDLKNKTLHSTTQEFDQANNELNVIKDETKKLANDTVNAIKDDLQNSKKEAQEILKHAQEEGLENLKGQGVGGVVQGALAGSIQKGSGNEGPNPTEFP